MDPRTRLIVKYWLGRRRVAPTSHQAEPAAALKASLAAILTAEAALGMPPVRVPAGFSWPGQTAPARAA